MSEQAKIYVAGHRGMVGAANLARFPQDFMFQLSAGEFTALRSQTVTSNTGRGGRRTAPYAFVEQGVEMLSSVLGIRRFLQRKMAEYEKLREEIDALNSEAADQSGNAQMEKTVGL